MPSIFITGAARGLGRAAAQRFLAGHVRGLIVAGPPASADAATVAKLVQVNCTGVTLDACAAHPYLQCTPGAQLLNMFAASASHGQPGVAACSASKFYVAGLTESLNLEWRDDDIRGV